MKIEIFKGKDKQWYFHIKARNGQIICASEGYTRKSSAIRGARQLIIQLTLRRVKIYIGTKFHLEC